nr:metallophosphoesterase [Oxobacter pfennigii]
MKKHADKGKKIISIILALISLIIFCYWQNNSIAITKSDYKNPKIPKEFEGFVIAQISDLHNKEFGNNQNILLDKLKSISPDIIVVTGDLIDRRKYNLEISMEFIEGAVEIAPVYYVSGNHEEWSGKYEDIKSGLLNAGVKVLDDEKDSISIENASIDILGLRDPDFYTSNYLEGTKTAQLEANLKKWTNDNGFKILLSHRPELFDLYVKSNMDLIFSGHAHGGQVRLPFIGGLVAPDQGFFPKYTSGHHVKNNSTMYISRGLGNSIIPLRIFNRPEIVEVTLKNTN